MKKTVFKKFSFWVALFFTATFFNLSAQIADNETVIRPREIDDVLSNPGMGLMTFQRFNGDKLNEGNGWTEGFPIDYQEFDGDLTNINHPATTIAY